MKVPQVLLEKGANPDYRNPVLNFPSSMKIKMVL